MKNIYKYIGFKTTEICKWFGISSPTTYNYLKIFDIDRIVVKQYGETYYWILINMPIECFDYLNKIKNKFESYEKFMEYITSIMYKNVDEHNDKIIERSVNLKVVKEPKLLCLNAYFNENIPNLHSSSPESIERAINLINK